jgi:hypothetical protein
MLEHPTQHALLLTHDPFHLVVGLRIWFLRGVDHTSYLRPFRDT